ncbi:MAG: sigma-70 family RNA polymerase sigma factor [Armatimonadetes bacterium]|nr:sigma-70 family RNA polymerase sigma factor [Armatimonadota bacterium]MBS1700405.1 sigma-70 family RNA polymerase sigma factor [Armatimonadota bacterium]MBS1725333.1 sigma-70 family RNA polymerase sigma factor [Armatimonadota bacterium]
MSEFFQNDAILVEKAQRGDKAALNELIRKYQERTYQYAFRLTRNPEEACDVVADAFLRVNNAIKNFKGNSAFSTWLYRIVTNCYLDRRKRDRSKSLVSIDATVHHDHEEITREIEDSGNTPDELAERNQREVMLQRALNKLPEFQKAMIIMFHAEQQTYEEIAEALDLPLGTVKSRLNRARISLRELLAENEELFKV